jgi:hypothetical protein
VNLKGQKVSLRNLDSQRRDGEVLLDIVDLDRIYKQPDNEWRFCRSRTPTPLRMFATVEDPNIENQKLITLNETGEIVGHIVASSADWRCGSAELSVIRHAAHPWAVEGIPLFIDLLFDTTPLRVLDIRAPESNARQFSGLLVKSVLGEPVIRPSRYFHAGKWEPRYEYELWRESWIASGYAHGGYLRQMSHQPVG